MLKQKIIEAYNFAKDAHNGQRRKFVDKEYFIHPKYVARIIEDLTKDEDMIIVALLHDVIEDTDYNYSDIEDCFGNKIAEMVLMLSNCKTRKDISKLDLLKEKISSMTNDCLLIKIADRYHNVKYLDKDCTTVEHFYFIKKYYDETRLLMPCFREKAIGLPQHNILLDGIEFQLNYLKIKNNLQ